MPQTAEKLVKSLNAELSITQKQIEEATQKLRDTENKTKSANIKAIQAGNELADVLGKIEEANADYKAKLVVVEEIKKRIEKEEAKLTQSTKTLKDEVLGLEAEKKLVIKDINERKTYLTEQEAKINDVVESGNDRIMELNHEASVLETRKTSLEIEIADGAQLLNQTRDDLNTIQAQLSELTTQYEQVNKTYQKTLEGLKSRIDAANIDYQMKTTKGQEIIERLAIKEEEFKTREGILADREYKVAQEEKAWASRHNLNV